MNQLATLYSAMEEDTRNLARNAVTHISGIQQRLVTDIAEIGATLLRVKQAVGHGNFLPWLKAEFDWAERTAQNFMAVAERFGSNPQSLAHLPLTTVYKLAGASTPEAVRTDIVTRLQNGETVADWEIKDQIKVARRQSEEIRRAAAKSKRRQKLTPAALAREERAERAEERRRKATEQRRVAWEAAISEASTIIVASLGEAACRRVIELLTGEPGYLDLSIGPKQLLASLETQRVR